MRGRMQNVKLQQVTELQARDVLHDMRLAAQRQTHSVALIAAQRQHEQQISMVLNQQEVITMSLVRPWPACHFVPMRKMPSQVILIHPMQAAVANVISCISAYA